MVPRNSRRLFIVHAATTLAIPAIAGCGAFKNAVNDRIDPIRNPGNLEGKQFPVPLTAASSGTVSGSGTYSGPFPDIAPVNRQNLLTFAELVQNVQGEITVYPNSTLLPETTVYPAQIVFRDISLTVRLSEAAGAADASVLEVTIPALKPSSQSLVFARVADTNRYRWTGSGEIPLGAVRVGGSDAKRLFSLLTSADPEGRTTNYVSASLSVVADAAGIENTVSAFLFTFGTGEARVGI